MRLAFNFPVAYANYYSHVVFGNEIETYLAWLERLKKIFFWMAYNANRWPTDLISPRGKWRSLDGQGGGR